MPRLKHVYPTEEVAHLWAHGMDRDIRNKTYNVFTDHRDQVIYSYGSHFPMARRVVVKSGEVIYLYNPDSYSMTTAGHQCMVRRAIPSMSQVFHLPPSMWGRVQHRGSGIVLREHYQHLIDLAMCDANNTRNGYPRRRRACQSAIELRGYYNSLHNLLHLRTRKDIALPTMPDLTESEKRWELREQRAAIKREEDRKRWEEDNKEYVAKQEARKKELMETLPERITAWRKGESVSTEYFPDTQLMRITTNKNTGEDWIETTMGVRAEANEVIRFIKEDLPGVFKHPSGLRVDVSIGIYRGVIATPEGLCIGCHRFNWKEIRQMIWNLKQEVPADVAGL